LLRPETAAFLQGCDHIIHAGDICEASVLDALRKIAPVTAVRGNNDHGEWAAELAETETLQIGEVLIHVLHNLAELDIDPSAAGVRVVVSGHTHKPLIEKRGDVFYVNPGSAGPRRFSLPIAIGELRISGNSVTPRVQVLEIAKPG
jgi:putative phosphoesterase